jgi:hypothetical protein
MINFIRKIFNINNKQEFRKLNHFACTVYRDKNNRLRHKVFINGELAKEEITFEGWYRINS